MARHEVHRGDRDHGWARRRAPEAHGRVLGRWRPSTPSRLFGLVLAGVFLVFGSLFVADGAAAGDRVGGAVVLVVGPAVSWLIWGRPYLVLTDEEVVVQNAFVAFVVPSSKSSMPRLAVGACSSECEGASLRSRRWRW